MAIEFFYLAVGALIVATIISVLGLIASGDSKNEFMQEQFFKLLMGTGLATALFVCYAIVNNLTVIR